MHFGLDVRFIPCTELQSFLLKTDDINNFCSNFSMDVHEKIYFEA